jgi:hypothetical protein
VAAEWQTPWYPLEATYESVQQWLTMIDQMRVEYLGPWEEPERAAELQAGRENDLALIYHYSPHLHNAVTARLNRLPGNRCQQPVQVQPVESPSLGSCSAGKPDKSAPGQTPLTEIVLDPVSLAPVLKSSASLLEVLQRYTNLAPQNSYKVSFALVSLWGTAALGALEVEIQLAHLGFAPDSEVNRIVGDLVPIEFLLRWLIRMRGGTTEGWGVRIPGGVWGRETSYNFLPNIERELQELQVIVADLHGCLESKTQSAQRQSNPEEHSEKVKETEEVIAKGTKQERSKSGRPKKLETRDKWIYQQCCKGSEMPYDQIVAELKRVAPKKGWRKIDSVQGIRAAAINYAQRNGLPLPPKRQDL